MKKHIFLYFSLFFLIISCSKEEEPTPPPPTPKFTVSFTAGEGGSVSTSGGTYDKGTKVSVTATPDGEFVFDKWSDGNTDNPREVTVSSNLSLSASFVKKKYALSVTVEGEGTVEEEIIVQGSTSSTEYNSGTTVKLTATPSDEWVFSGWSGDIESTDNPIEVTVSEAKSITATFKLKQYDLTVTVEGEGTVSETIVTQPTLYDSGTVVKLEATPSDEWVFSGWSGDIDSTDNPIEVSVNETKEITATFKLKQYDLTINIEGEGTVSETIITQPTLYDSGTVVKLEAVASEGWIFDKFTGDFESVENPSQITLDSAITVQANFKRLVTLNINVSENGQFGSYRIETLDGKEDSNSGTYSIGSIVRISAIPSENGVFCGWSDNVPNYNEEIIELVLENDMTINLCFTEKNKVKLQLNIIGKGTVTDGNWMVNNDSTNPLEGVEKEYYQGQEINLIATGDNGSKFLMWKRLNIGNDNERNYNEMNFIMNDQHIINIYFAPEYYSENKVRFDNSNYSENLVNLSPTLLGATVKFYVKSNDKELFVAAGTNPVYNENRAPTITFIRESQGWKIDKIHYDARSMASRNMKIISDSEFMFADSGEHGSGPWRGDMYYAQHNNGEINWTKVNSLSDRMFFHGVTAGDLNGDGLVDFGGVPNDPEFKVFIQESPGNFIRKNELIDLENSPTGVPFTWEFSDLDDDGIDEIITADYGGGFYNSNSNNKINNITIFKYNPTDNRFVPVFVSDEPTKLSDFGLGATSIITKDFNNDGNLDIAVAREEFNACCGIPDSNSIEVWLNTGGLTFELSYTKLWKLNELQFREFVVVDANNDGYNDIVLRSNNGVPYYWTDNTRTGVSLNESILINNGQGGFSSYSNKDLTYYNLPRPAQLNAYTKDGKLGIISIADEHNNWQEDGYFETFILDLLIDLNE